MLEIQAIVAINEYGFLGSNGKMMWHNKEDLKHFVALTKGAVCVVGATTFEGDLKGKEMKGRELIILGKNYCPTANEVLTQVLEKTITIEESKIKQTKPIFIIGGLKVYKTFEPFITSWHISKISDTQIGDVYFEITDSIREKATFYQF